MDDISEYVGGCIQCTFPDSECQQACEEIDGFPSVRRNTWTCMATAGPIVSSGKLDIREVTWLGWCYSRLIY